jgi:hypothetical protein
MEATNQISNKLATRKESALAPNWTAIDRTTENFCI